MEAGFSQIQSHTIAIIANPTLNHSTYFTIALNESAINPGHFGPIQGNCTVFFMLNLISRSCDMHILYPNEAILQRHLQCNKSDIRQVLGNNYLLGSYSPVQCLIW